MDNDDEAKNYDKALEELQAGPPMSDPPFPAPKQSILRLNGTDAWKRAAESIERTRVAQEAMEVAIATAIHTALTAGVHPRDIECVLKDHVDELVELDS